MELAFCIENREDGLQPLPSQLDLATNEAQKYRYSLADEAKARLVLLSESGTKANLTAALSFTMRPTETERCNALNATKEVHSALLVGTQSPIACHLTGASFKQFGVNGSDGRKLPNFTGILSLAWACILSSRLVELQQQHSAEVLTRVRLRVGSVMI